MRVPSKTLGYAVFTPRNFKYTRGIFPKEKDFFSNKATVLGISGAFQEINENRSEERRVGKEC